MWKLRLNCSSLKSNAFENNVCNLWLCYLVLRYLENNTELENSLKDVQMPSKKFGSITIGKYGKFKNMFYLSLPFLPSASRSCAEKRDRKVGCSLVYCGYSALRSKTRLFFFYIDKHSVYSWNLKIFLSKMRGILMFSRWSGLTLFFLDNYLKNRSPLTPC